MRVNFVQALKAVIADPDLSFVGTFVGIPEVFVMQSLLRRQT
jgi:hypothetical protein